MSTEKVRGHRFCINCSGPLVDKQFSEGQDVNGKPSDVTTDPWCEPCDVRWIAFVDASQVMLPHKENWNLTRSAS